MPAALHEGQHEIGIETVRRLVDGQFPAWAGLPLTLVPDGGTVHAVFRLGDGLAVRLPLLGDDPAAAEAALREESGRAAALLGRTRFPTPAPVAIGRPGAGYPLPWAVHTWVPGTPATAADPSASAAFAEDLAEFVRGVRALGTGGRVHDGRGRGGRDLRAHDAWMAQCLDRSADLYDVAVLRELWASMRTLPRGAEPDVLSHGDLIPGNVLVAGGRLTGVLDVGGLGPADPALDLVAAWHLLDAVPRAVFRAALGVDDLTWARGRAWAFEQAVGVGWYYAASHPAMSRMGRRTVERIVADRAATDA